MPRCPTLPHRIAARPGHDHRVHGETVPVTPVADGAPERLPPSHFGRLAGQRASPAAGRAKGRPESVRGGSGWTPPAHLAPHHDPVWAESLWARLWQVVDEPVQRVVHAGVVSVQVLGVMRWRRDVAGDGPVSVRVFSLVPDPEYEHPDPGCAWRAAPAVTVGLRPMLEGWNWLDPIQRLVRLEWFRHQNARGASVEAEHLHDYLKSFFRHFRRRLAASGRLRPLRRAVLAALPLDPVLLRACDRLIRLDARERTLEDYRFVERHGPALRELERRFPQLVAPYAALCEAAGFPRRSDPVEALHAHLMGQGVAPRTWRLLLDASPRLLLLPMRHFYSGDPGMAVLDFLHILQDLGARRAPPPWFLWCALSSVANPEYRFNEHQADLRPALPAWGVALHALQERAADPPPRDEVAAVAGWIYRVRPQLDKRQRRAGWPWLLRSAQAWAGRERAAREHAGQVWTTPEPTARLANRLADLGYVLQPIVDGLTLWDEGQAMRHCIADSLDPCLTGAARVYSVRRLSDPARRAATVRLRRGHRWWCLDGVRGFANQDPPSALVSALERWLRSVRLPVVSEDPYAAEPGLGVCEAKVSALIQRSSEAALHGPAPLGIRASQSA